MMLAVQNAAGAYRDYMMALTLDPLDTDTLDGLVRAAVATSREAEVVERLKSLPQHPAIRVAISKLLATSGAFDEAITVVAEAGKTTPDQERALVNLGLLELESGNRATAVRYFAEALSLDPDSAAARQGLAQVFVRHGLYSRPGAKVADR